MSHKLATTDFRAVRYVLDPSDFALGSDEPDPPPTDLITEEAWHGIMNLPDDVAIRTTSHQGSRVALLYDLWGAWIEMLSLDPIKMVPIDRIMNAGMLNSADCFAAALFNLVHGFYKQALASLRDVLETMVLACDCSVMDNKSKWEAWESGSEIEFRNTCVKLGAREKFSAMEQAALDETQARIFPVKQGKGRYWIEDLYARICVYSHARGHASNAAIWDSNGPIYSAEGMRTAYQTFLETFALVTVLASVTLDKLTPPEDMRFVFDSDSLQQYVADPFRHLCAYYTKKLFSCEDNGS